MSRVPAHARRPSLRGMGDGIEDLAAGVAVRLLVALPRRGRPAAGLRHLGHRGPRRPAGRPRARRTARRRPRTASPSTSAHRVRAGRPAARGHRRRAGAVPGLVARPRRGGHARPGRRRTWRRAGGPCGRRLARAALRGDRSGDRRRGTGPRTRDAPSRTGRRRRPRSWPSPLATGAVEPTPEPPDEALLALTGPVRWICEAVVDHLTCGARRNRTLRAHRLKLSRAAAARSSRPRTGRGRRSAGAASATPARASAARTRRSARSTSVPTSRSTTHQDTSAPASPCFSGGSTYRQPSSSASSSSNSP